jgi:hypothetical protein
VDDLFGLLIFLVVAAIGVLGKVFQKPQTGESDTPAAPPVKPEQLPEVLRRMLMGEAPPVRKARPAQSENDEGPMQPEVRVPQRAPYQPPIARPAQTEPREGQPRRKVIVQAPPQPREPAAPPRMRPEQIPPAARPIRIPQAMKPVPKPALRVPTAPQPAAQRSPAPQPAPARRLQPKAVPAGAFFRNVDEIRRGIIVSEILAPPVSLRRM